MAWSAKPMADDQVRLSWGHININVSRLERSVDFYAGLGFTPFMQAIPYLGITADRVSEFAAAGARALGLPVGTRGRGCILQLGQGFPKLDLTEVAGSRSGTPVTNGDLGLVRLCLGSTNLARDYARLSGAGVHFLTPPETMTGELADVAVCADPDGTLIELIQIDLDKWAALGDG
jgi:catechol 2,3-dioxygenase-like lactoylglutathione lyase family enzyme